MIQYIEDHEELCLVWVRYFISVTYFSLTVPGNPSLRNAWKEKQTKKPTALSLPSAQFPCESRCLQGFKSSVTAPQELMDVTLPQKLIAKQ